MNIFSLLAFNWSLFVYYHVHKLLIYILTLGYSVCSSLCIVKRFTNIFSSQDSQIWLTKNMRYRCLRYATQQYNSTEKVIFKPWVHNSTCVIQFPEYIILTLNMKCFQKIMIIWPDAFERWSMSILCMFFFQWYIYTLCDGMNNYRNTFLQ